MEMLDEKEIREKNASLLPQACHNCVPGSS